MDPTLCGSGSCSPKPAPTRPVPRSKQEGRDDQSDDQGDDRDNRGDQDGDRGDRGDDRDGRGGDQGDDRGDRDDQDYDFDQLSTSSVSLQHFVKRSITTNQQKKEHRKARQVEKKKLQSTVKNSQLASIETIDD